MGTVLRKERCNVCAQAGRDNNGDNLAIYEDGSEYCFSCKFSKRGNEDVQAKEKPMGVPMIEGKVIALEKRHISKQTCEFAHTYVSKVHGKWVHIYEYKNKYNERVAQKIRFEDKSFRIFGDSSALNLWLMHLWTPSDKIGVTITEGELDCLSILESTDCKYPVVSIPTGASSAKKFLQKHLKWLLGFKHVNLAFDMDDAGKAATKECLTLFEPGKVKVVNWTKKDASDVLVQLGAIDVSKCVLRATVYKPEGVLTWSDVEESVLNKPVEGHAYPWPSLTKYTHGVRPGELITILGAAGLGKTSFISEIMLELIYKHKVNVGVMSLEQLPHQTFRSIIGKIMGKAIHNPDVKVDPEEISRVGKELQDKLYCYDHTGAIDFGNVRNLFRFFVKALGCKVIMIDNLSSIAAAFDSDERRNIDKVMVELASWCLELNVTIFLVAHISRPPSQGLSSDEGRKLSLSSARGSEGIGQASSLVLGLERNALSEDESVRNLMTVRILKDRQFGHRGESFQLKYNTQTTRLVEYTATYNEEF